MTNFFTYGGRDRYLGKWTMNFLSSFGTMALAGIVQSAYTNSVWEPRAEAATQALVENANTLPWTIVRDRNTNETYIVPGNADSEDSSKEDCRVKITTVKPDYFGFDSNQNHSKVHRSLDVLESLPLIENSKTRSKVGSTNSTRRNERGRPRLAGWKRHRTG